MDLVRIAPEDRQFIQRYGAGGFTVSGTRFSGSVIVFPDETVAWNPSENPFSIETLARVIERAADIDLCLIGSGSAMKPVPAALRERLRGEGIGVDAMDTGAACRTFNMLIAEDRAVAAALVAL